MNLKEIVKGIKNSIVSIETIINEHSAIMGTGFITSADGYVVTCQHLLKDQEKT